MLHQTGDMRSHAMFTVRYTLVTYTNVSVLVALPGTVHTDPRLTTWWKFAAAAADDDAGDSF